MWAPGFEPRSSSLVSKNLYPVSRLSDLTALKIIIIKFIGYNPSNTEWTLNVRPHTGCTTYLDP